MNRSAPRPWGIVPVKPFTLAKRRLAALLGPQERARLARTMLEDVLAALAATPVLAGVLVVTADAQAAAIAVAAGARVVPERDGDGLNAALGIALQHLPGGPGQSAMIVPADLPAIQAADVEVIARCHRPAPAVTAVASRNGGTNLLVLSPRDAIPLQFGRDSFSRHVRAAHAAGIAPQVLRLPRAALDIDEPADVLALLARATPTRSHAYLAALELEGRLGLAHTLAGG